MDEGEIIPVCCVVSSGNPTNSAFMFSNSSRRWIISCLFDEVKLLSSFEASVNVD